MPIRLPVVLSPSRTELGSRCHRRHFLQDVLDLRLDSEVPASREFGTVLHAGAGALWRGRYLGEFETVVAQQAMEAVRVTWNELRPEGDKHSLEMAEALMQHYISNAKLAANLPGEWHVAVIDGQPMIEQRWEVNVGDNVLSFQIDRMLENSRGQLAFVDLKTAARLDARWRRGFDLWLQGKLYKAALLERIGTLPDFVVVEGMLKAVPTKIEYHNCPEWDESQIEEALRQFAHVAEQDRKLLVQAMVAATERHCSNGCSDAEFEQRWREEALELGVSETAFNYQDCNSYGGVCPFHELCNRPVEQRFGLVQLDYRVQPTEGY